MAFHVIWLLPGLSLRDHHLAVPRGRNEALGTEVSHCQTLPQRGWEVQVGGPTRPAPLRNLQGRSAQGQGGVQSCSGLHWGSGLGLGATYMQGDPGVWLKPHVPGEVTIPYPARWKDQMKCKVTHICLLLPKPRPPPPGSSQLTQAKSQTLSFSPHLVVTSASSSD